MDRKDFIKGACLVCAGLAAGLALEGCSKNNVSPTSVNFSLDLSASSNSALNTVGGYVVQNGVVVIRTGTSTYVAFSNSCTHNGCTVSYDSNTQQFICPCHSGVFNSSGTPISGPPSSPLPQYKTSLSGNTLSVTS